MANQLTKHPSGSVRELWAVSLPMIFALLSGSLMIFFDRLFLANYSTEAMNAAAVAGNIAAIGQFGFATVTAIAEVYVGKFNGAKEYRRASSPTWQMLWVSACTPLLFIPLAIFGGPALLPDYHFADAGYPYFKWILYFAAFTPAISAIAAFFVGIGHTRLVMVLTIIANVLNLVLDPLLIFGWEGWIPSMGAKGAAIATGIALLTHFVLLMGLFLTKKYREKYNTGNFKLDFPLLKRCLRVGVPSSLGHMIEWTAWAISNRLMADVSEFHLTVATVGQSIYMLIAFGFEGLQKGVTAIASNNMGASLYENVWNTWRSAVKILFLFSIPFGVLLLVYPDPLIAEFLSMETPPEDVVALTKLLRWTCFGVWIYYFVDGFTWICVGVLTAAEDTQYVMWMNALIAWMCGLMPMIILLVYMGYPPIWYWVILCFYGSCNALAFYTRMCKETFRDLKS